MLVTERVKFVSFLENELNVKAGIISAGGIITVRVTIFIKEFMMSESNELLIMRENKQGFTAYKSWITFAKFTTRPPDYSPDQAKKEKTI